MLHLGQYSSLSRHRYQSPLRVCRKDEQLIGEEEGPLAMPVNKALAVVFVAAPNGIEPLTALKRRRTQAAKGAVCNTALS